MCKLCLEHGEGEKWYLQTKNYAEELLNEERQAFIAGFYVDFERNAVKSLGRLDSAVKNADKIKLASVEEVLRRDHAGQVLPLEHAEQILNRATSIVRMPCACRSTLLGRSDSRYCLGIASFASDFLPRGFLEAYPDYATGLENITRDEALRQVRQLDGDGLVHTVWTYITPFVGSLCSCTIRDCVAFRMRLALGPRIVFKGEAIARVDTENCNGCRECQKQCPFGAISYSAGSEKCAVNQRACYGCGVCRAACVNEAITLLDRNGIPALAQEW